jgi:YggT family protein
MIVIDLIWEIVYYVIIGATIGVTLLVLARVIVNAADMNPFSRTALNVRQFSDPLVNPVRRFLLSYGLDQKIAPFVTILIAIVIAYLILQIGGSVVFTAKGVLTSLQRGALRPLMGYILFGLIAVYTACIVVRIVLSYGMRHGNRTMRFLVSLTDPILVPFRRIIPPIGMFDVSPMIVLLILYLIQQTILGTLIG